MSDSATNGLADVQLHLVDSVEKAQDFIHWLGERRPFDAIGLDIETGEKTGNPKADALSPWHGDIRLVQVGDGMQGWAIPWEEWAGVFYQGMGQFDGPIVCHNIAFEAKWFAVKSHWQMPWHRAHDTMLMAHIIDPLGSGALKRLASLYVDARSASLQDTLSNTLTENGWTWGSVPVNFPPYWTYGALDPVITMRLWEKFYKECGPTGAYSRPYEIEMATRKIVTRMEINGARVDLDYSKKKYEELIDYTEKVKAWAAQTYDGVSITSNVQLVRLFERLGGVITDVTPSGQKSASKDQIEKLLIEGNNEVKQLADTVLKQRKADKLANTYFLNFMDKHVDGFLHPSVRTLGARTGRMSITDPALQTLPSGEATVRRAFIPKDEKHIIISSDLDQVEFRLAASMSGDQQLISMFHKADAEGGDAFTEIMRDIYQDQTLQKSDNRRKLVKGCVPLSSEILTKRGWLTYDKVTTDDETLGYDFSTRTSRWTKIQGVHVYEDSDIYLLHNGHKSFLCTEDHRWIADNGRSGERATTPKIIHANELPGTENRLILAAPAEDGALDISIGEATLLGWILGDGSIKREESVGAVSQGLDGWRVGCQVKIYQTKVDQVYVLDQLLSSVPHTRWVNNNTGQVVWTINPDYARDLLKRAGITDKKTFSPWELALGMSMAARQKMIDALDAADGKNKKEKYVAIVQAADSPVAELCIALGYLTGKFSRNTTYQPDGKNWQRNDIKVIWHQKATMGGQRTSLDYVSTGTVWCVTTDLGTWTMRQSDGVPVLTGNTVYGKLFGAGVSKMALTAGVAEEQMKSVVDAFDRSYPGVKQLQHQIEDVGTRRLKAEGQGYVLTKTGRRLPCDDNRVYSLTNYLIQSSAAEIFKMNLIKLDMADLTELLIVPVHDEIVLQAPRENAEEIMKIVQECMTTTDGWEVPLTAGVEGPFETWGDKY